MYCATGSLYPYHPLYIEIALSYAIVSPKEARTRLSTMQLFMRSEGGATCFDPLTQGDQLNHFEALDNGLKLIDFWASLEAWTSSVIKEWGTMYTAHGLALNDMMRKCIPQNCVLFKDGLLTNDAVAHSPSQH